MLSTMTYHKPVLLQQSIEALQIKSGGTYVDLTFGGGGHSIAILENIKDGILYGFDQDQDAAENAERITSKSFKFIKNNFRFADKLLRVHGVTKVDGILADLGVSSHQIDTPERGFSTRFEGELDMRMDKNSSKNAKQVINKYTEKDLHRILGMYGEVKNAKSLASAIVIARTQSSINTNEDLKRILEEFAPRGREFKYFAQVFQALRIEVNNELEVLKEMLTRCMDILKPGGRFVIISYHSLEDRLVKNFFNKGKFFGDVDKDVFGNELKPLKAITRKPVLAEQSEILENKRARSAKMRIAEKL
jgi:16S rRNA (cytosine1402-N4)-methyltransferase